MAPVEVNVVYDPDKEFPDGLLERPPEKLPKFVADGLNAEHKAARPKKLDYPLISKEDVRILVSEMDPNERGPQVMEITIKGGERHERDTQGARILIGNKVAAGPWERKGWVDDSRLTLTFADGEESSGQIGGRQRK